MPGILCEGAASSTCDRAARNRVQRLEQTVDVGRLAPVIDDARAEHEAAGELGARDERLAAELQAIEDRAVQRIVAAVSKAHDAQAGRDELEARRRRNPIREIPRERDVPVDDLAQSVEAEMLQRHPDLQRAKA